MGGRERKKRRTDMEKESGGDVSGEDNVHYSSRVSNVANMKSTKSSASSTNPNTAFVVFGSERKSQRTRLTLKMSK